MSAEIDRLRAALSICAVYLLIVTHLQTKAITELRNCIEVLAKKTGVL